MSNNQNGGNYRKDNKKIIIVAIAVVILITVAAGGVLGGMILKDYVSEREFTAEETEKPEKPEKPEKTDKSEENDDYEEDSDFEYVKSNGELKIGVTVYEPMNYKETNGEWTGFDTELARMVCDELGVEAEFVEISWDDKELELITKGIDCIWNGFTQTDERLEIMSFTDSYITVWCEYDDERYLETYAVGFRKDSDIPRKVNRILKKFEKDGTIDRLADVYEIEPVK